MLWSFIIIMNSGKNGYYIMPPMPPIPGAPIGISGLSSFFSTITHSVVRNIPIHSNSMLYPCSLIPFSFPHILIHEIILVYQKKKDAATKCNIPLIFPFCPDRFQGFYTLISAFTPRISLFFSSSGRITFLRYASTCSLARPTYFSGFIVF